MADSYPPIGPYRIESFGGNGGFGRSVRPLAFVRRVPAFDFGDILNIVHLEHCPCSVSAPSSPPDTTPPTDTHWQRVQGRARRERRQRRAESAADECAPRARGGQ
jgi:hypothetical protein